MTLTRKISLLLLMLFSSQSLIAQDDDFVFYSELSRDWYQGGDYFEWTSTTEDNNDALDAEELSAVLAKLHLHMTPEEVLEEIVEHGEQELSYDQLEGWW